MPTDDDKKIYDEIEKLWLDDLLAQQEKGVDDYTNLVDLAWSIRHHLVQERHQHEELKQIVRALRTLLIPDEATSSNTWDLKQRAQRMLDEAYRKGR